MKNIVLLGAGSTAFTLELVRDIVLTEGLAGSTLRLVDIDEGRLENARRIVELYKTLRHIRTAGLLFRTPGTSSVR